MQQSEPANPEEIFQVVSNAASQDPQLVTSSTKRLKELLLLPGTFEFLSQITVQRSLPLPMRQQSIIQLKNAALPHWKARRLLTDEQRAQIRSRTLSLLEDEDETIAECNNVILSKIARIDYPSNWPALISDIMLSINNNLQVYIASGGSDSRSYLLLRRGLAAMNGIIKEFTSIKMPAGIKVMGQLVQQLQPTLQSHYATLASTFGSQLTPERLSSQEAGDVLQLAHINYKCLSKMMVWLWHRLTINTYKELMPWVQEFFSNSTVQLRLLYELRINLAMGLEKLSSSYSKPSAERTVTLLTRHVRHLGKFFRRLQQLSVSRFILLPSCNDLVLYYWGKVVHATSGPSIWIADSPLAIYPTQYVVQAMVLFKESLAQWSPTKHGDNSDATLSKVFVEEAVRLLVTHFIPLSSEDVSKWYEDPEDWANAEAVENDQWEFEPRACAERVLVTLANQYKQFVAPLLVAMFEEFVDQQASNVEGIVQKEAVYCAIGRCAIRLKEHIPFESWVAQRLRNEAFATHQGSAILKRRIAWLIGRWISEECASPNNETVWTILMHLIADHGPSSDIAVRLVSATALRECIDTNAFSPDIFLPHLHSSMEQLVRLAAEAESFEARRRVMDVLNVVIERMENRVVSHSNIIVEAIPSLWLSAGEDYLFKASMLVTIKTAVIASKEYSRMFDVIALPLIRECLTMPEARANLDEDALNLWHVVSVNAVRSDGGSDLRPLIELFPIASSLLGENLDLLGSILDVIESYIVLDANSILQAYAVELFRAYVKAINQAPTAHVKEAIITLQYIYQLAPASLWAEPLHVSGLFTCLLLQLNEDRGSTNIRTELILTFARMAIADANLVAQLVSASAASRECSEESLWKDLLDQWWRRFDNMSEPRNRKLVAMGIACLVTTGRRDVLDRLDGEIFNLWLDVFGEIKEALAEAEEEGNRADGEVNLLWWDVDFDRTRKAPDTDGTPEYERRKQIYENDPVKTEKLTSYIAQRLQYTQNLYGVQRFEQDFLDKTDPAVLKQLQDELSSNR